MDAPGKDRGYQTVAIHPDTEYLMLRSNLPRKMIFSQKRLFTFLESILHQVIICLFLIYVDVLSPVIDLVQFFPILHMGPNI